jgi:hypothetical protein
MTTTEQTGSRSRAEVLARTALVHQLRQAGHSADEAAVIAEAASVIAASREQAGAL